MHDKDLWKDPDEFRPERWNEEGADELPDSALYAFGFGRRYVDCLGWIERRFLKHWVAYVPENISQIVFCTSQ